MGTDKRARQKANRQARLAEVEAESTKEQREQSTRKIGTIAAVIAALVAIFVLFNVLTGGDDASGEAQFAPTPAAEEAPTAVPEIVLLDAVPADFVPFAGEGALALVEPTARNNAYREAPPMTIDPSSSYAAVLDTDIGPVRLDLFADETPTTVNNFVSLARDGFYDGVQFHRVLPGFMAQGGDPTGSGSGGPGYSFGDEVDTGRAFDEAGLLAMANAGPGTNGSQFFIMFEVQEQDILTGNHTIFGKLNGDISVLDDIVRTGEGEPTVINSVRIIEG